MNRTTHIVALALIAFAAAISTPATALGQAGLFGPSGKGSTANHDFSVPAASTPVDPKPRTRAVAPSQAASRPTRPATRTNRPEVETPATEPVPETTIESAPVADPTFGDEPAAATPAPQATAQDDDTIPFMHEDAAETEAEQPGAGGLLVRTVGALLLIVGLLVGVGWGLKRVGGPKFGTPRNDAPELSVLASVALGDRKSLTVVRFGERTLLVGSTTSGITLLADEHEYDRPPVRSVGYLLESSEVPSFDDELARATKGDLR